MSTRNGTRGTGVRSAARQQGGAGRADAAGSRGPLAGLLVVDLSRALAGPHAAMMLGDLGARVIKVEVPGRGDDSRAWGPPFVAVDGAPESTYFLAANRNKESIILDLKAPDDADVLRRLVARADVLIENFRPGALDRLGLAISALTESNPRLVVLSISGFGHDGPEAGRPGYDQIVQGEAGLMRLTGPGPDDPQRVGVPIADLVAGMYGAYGVVAALRERDGNGHGQVVRTSLLAAVVASHALHGSAWTVAGKVGHPQGNHHPSIAPYGMFRCRDGAVQVACGNESLWRRFCSAFALDADASGFSTNAERVAHKEMLIANLERTFADHDASDILDRLAAAEVPAGRVRSINEVYDWEQTRSQGLVIGVDHPTLGRIELPGPPLRFFCHDGQTELTRLDHRAPPVLGAHQESVTRWLGAGAAG
jgi:crotonobetainyl-CoA:carnitine CoA-transferase CaiB-like acyl-CoA transferase